MIPRIETIPEKKLIGQRLLMSLANDKTFALWSRFMPVRKKITNAVTTDLVCMQVYAPSFDFLNFNAEAVFEKWAAVEVTAGTAVPDEMEACTLPGGLYAVFIHKGAAITATQTFGYIFQTWLPQSGYVLDNRPHFEILGAKYKNNHPDSEEEIWIPVKPKV
jgi:AraC family transcriptional regulator